MKPYKLIANGINGAGYDVMDRATGAKIGEVVKHTRYYNIAPRGCKVTYWRASNVQTNFGTRTEALDALLAAQQPRYGVWDGYLLGWDTIDLSLEAATALVATRISAGHHEEQFTVIATCSKHEDEWADDCEKCEL